MSDLVDSQNAEMVWYKKSGGSISFIHGFPGPETMHQCRELMLSASKTLLSEDAAIAEVFSYGVENGAEDFRQQLALFLSQEYGDTIASSDLQISAGATQGLQFILTILCDKSAPIFVEDPTYFAGYRMMQDDLQRTLVPVPVDSEGMDADILDKLLTAQKASRPQSSLGHRFWAAVYLIPVFSNPMGMTYTADRCKRLVQLARKHNILLIAEDVYNLIHFNEGSHPPPRLLSYDRKSDPEYGDGHVVSNGTFSKILAPGLRLGWIEGSQKMLQTMKTCNLTFSGGSFNHYTSKLVTSIMKQGHLHQHLAWLRTVYKKRMDALCQALDENLPAGCSYVRPKGGFFLWLVFPENCDVFPLAQFAREKYDINLLGGKCTSPTGKYKNCARLSISTITEAKARDGVMKLCQAFQELYKKCRENSLAKALHC